MSWLPFLAGKIIASWDCLEGQGELGSELILGGAAVAYEEDDEAAGV